MSAGTQFRYDFFVSRRGTVAAASTEVADVLTADGYAVFVQDYDIPLAANFVEAMHEAIKATRDLVVLWTTDYDESPHTRREFTSFLADAADDPNRHVVVLRYENAPLRGLFAPIVFQDLIGVNDPSERRRRILDAATGRIAREGTTPRPFHGVPTALQTFVGRELELGWVDTALTRHYKPVAITQARVAALRGLGGVGKTSLAIEYVHRYRPLYAGVWWCRAETRKELQQDLASLGIQLGVVMPDQPNVDGIALEHASRVTLDELAKLRVCWLLIYDNVPEPDLLNGLLPGAGARVLITSRFADWISVAEEIPLDVLPSEEAVEFLQKRAARVDPAGAAVLAECLGNLPLALDHAAAYCRRTQMTFGDYAIRAESLMSHRPRGVDYPKSVSATFDLAIQEAARHCPDADTVMDFLAFGAPERMPLSLITAALGDEMKLNAALAALAEVSLLRFDPLADGTPAVTLHRLVLAVGRARVANKGRTREVVTHLLTGLTSVFPSDTYDDPTCWAVCERLAPHLLTVRTSDLEGSAIGLGWPELLNRAGNYFLGNGGYVTAEPLLREAVDLGARILGRDNPQVGRWLNDFALLLSETGRRSEAEPLMREALSIIEQCQGRVDRDVGATLSNLAHLLTETGRHIEAEQLFHEALGISEALLDPNDPEIATDLINLAYVMRLLGRFSEAERLCRRAISIDEEHYGNNHPSALVDWENLADVLIASDRTTEALPLAEKALNGLEEAFGCNHPWSKDAAETAVDALAALGRDAEAEEIRARYRLPLHG